MVAALVEAGDIDHILLACDVDTPSLAHAYGGGGYAGSVAFDQLLLAAGLTHDQIARITVDNPRNLLGTASVS